MIGVDIFKIDRVEKLKQRKTFYKRFFTSNEYAFIEKKNFSNETIAGLIAAKEAVAKMFKTGISTRLGLLDIEILHDNAVPKINMENRKIKSLALAKGVQGLDISISHDGEYAIATCVSSNRGAIRVQKQMAKLLPKRDESFNKYDYGKVLIIGGKKGMSGSVRLAARAAMRTGAGMVYVYTPESITNVLALSLVEPIIYMAKENNKGEFSDFDEKEFIEMIRRMDSIAIGPGMGSPESGKKMIELIFKNFEGPVVVDADGLNIISQEKDLLKLKKNVYITPHHMEFSRLSNIPVKVIDENREEKARAFLEEYNINLLLKGHETLVINKNNKYINPTGNSGMATAGSGDILTGMLAALLARVDNFDMLRLAAYIHGLCGDLAKIKYGEDSMVASDLIGQIPTIMKEMRDNE